ncbi:MAG TPA: AAA family ATPase [archaeon]|nr:AAA family ATPase [archaeon]
MKIGITGTPGTGKSAVAERLAKALKIDALNEKDFVLREKIAGAGKNYATVKGRGKSGKKGNGKGPEKPIKGEKPEKNTENQPAGKNPGKSAEEALEVPLDALEKKLNKMLAGKRSIIVEGHLLCDIKADFDAVFVLRCAPEKIGERLQNRGYNEVKVQDNVFCEETGYCLKHALENYGRGKVFGVECGKSIKETTGIIISELGRIESLKKGG